MADQPRLCIISRDPLWRGEFIAALKASLCPQESFQILMDRRRNGSLMKSLREDRRRQPLVDVALAAHGFAIVPAFPGRLPVRAGYCVDCLSQLWGKPVETIAEYLGETGSASRQAHCGNCGEHKDTFVVLLATSATRANGVENH